MTRTFEQDLSHLIDHIDTYLASLSSPGIDAVREGIATWRNGPVHTRSAKRLPPNRHMAEALEFAAASGQAALAEAIGIIEPQLEWISYDHYPPALIGEGFARGHSYAALMGREGCIRAEDFELGLFLIAPNVLYRDHRHAAPELYAPLTGPHGWRFSPGAPLEWRAAHVPVWNEPFQHHATRVGAVPFLCIFGWTRDVDEIATIIPCDDWSELEALSIAPHAQPASSKA